MNQIAALSLASLVLLSSCSTNAPVETSKAPAEKQKLDQEKLGWIDGSVWRDTRAKKFVYHYQVEVHGGEVWFNLVHRDHDGIDPDAPNTLKHVAQDRHFIAKNNLGAGEFSAEVTLSESGKIVTVSYRDAALGENQILTLSWVK
jgi:hypothetical protein